MDRLVKEKKGRKSRGFKRRIVEKDHDRGIDRAEKKKNERKGISRWADAFVPGLTEEHNEKTPAFE